MLQKVINLQNYVMMYFFPAYRKRWLGIRHIAKKYKSSTRLEAKKYKSSTRLDLYPTSMKMTSSSVT
jgi:hypothetical protein